MPQPIEEGMVLGGRYLVTGHVLTSADQDMVLDGRDQVLNRDVSILVASSDHASQVAASARELATGERQGTIQVLDLGLSEGRTYLIAGGNPAPDELLEMTSDQQVYVEPFYTDTLGSEIFGEARTYEPHVYEDDEEYYEELDDGFVEEDTGQHRPKFLRGISERLSQRLGSDDAARDAVAGGAVTGAAGSVAAGAAVSRTGEQHDDGAQDESGPARYAVRRDDGKPLPETVSDEDWTGPQDEVTVDTGETPIAAVASPAIGRHSPKPGRDPQQSSVDRPKVTLWDDDPPQNVAAELAAGAAAGAAGGAAAAASAGSARGPAGGSSAGGSSGGHGNHDDDDPGQYYEDDPEFDDFEDEDEDKPRGARWLIGGILVLVLILGAVLAFNILGNNRNPGAGDDSPGPEASPGSSSPEQSQDSQLPEPAIAGASRVVPDLPELSAETDTTLPNAVDGNPATAWQTYSFAQPAFGGYASNMALVIELEEASAISQVDITQNNGSGGSFSVLLSETPEIEDARQIAEGSFTGPQVSVPVPAEDGSPAEAQYVIINFTELPQLSNASSDLPFGLRIAEVEVN